MLFSLRAMAMLLLGWLVGSLVVWERVVLIPALTWFLLGLSLKESKVVGIFVFLG